MGEILHMSAVWTLYLYRRQCDDIFQESLLRLGGYLVKLIEVDEQHLRHCLQHVLLFSYIHVARIAPA